MKQNMIATYLRENPKAMGVLFSVCLLLMEGGSVAANGASAHAGP